MTKEVTKKMTKEEFINREPDILNGKYEFIGEYINANTKTLFKHNICGYKWEIRPSKFYRGSRCPKCSRRKKLTKKEFCRREKDIQSGEYIMLGEYRGVGVKTLFKHTTCGNEWKITPGNFGRGVRCPKCAVRKVAFTKKFFCSREKDIVSGEYEMLGEYAGTCIKTLFRHDSCGYEWEVTPSSFHTGTRCPRCAKLERFTKESFCEREPDIISGEYEMVGEYKNAITKTLFRHNHCGYEWLINPHHFHQGRRCPKCKKNNKKKVKQ